jgi:SAM-dependent methyltransferase
MPHVFDPEKASVLDSDERKKFFPPGRLIKLIEELDIRREVAFDIGAGTGYFAIPLSRIFKKVYAVDISFEMAEKLREKIEEAGAENIGIIVSANPPEVDFEVDLVLFSNVLHEMNNPEEYIEWASKSDCVIIVDWKKIKTPAGPPLDERIPLKRMLEMVEKRFEILKVEEELYPYHYVIVGK